MNYPTEGDLFVEITSISQCKYRETLCGDFCQEFGSRDRRIIAVSDGLGSGVRANILATLTATILGTMLDRNMPLEECVETVASTLPVSKQHGLAYATFTAIELSGDVAYIINYDNPKVIMLREGKPFRYPFSVRFVGDKEIHESRVKLQAGDILIAMTDGVTHSGIGKNNDNGWSIQEIQSFLMEKPLEALSAAEIAALIQHRCLDLCNGTNDDDTTTAVVKMRRHQTLNMLIGPPKDRKDDQRVLQLFFRKEGYHVVSGGSTSQMVARYLNKPLVVQSGSGNEAVPDMASIEGVDMVTEGVITLERACQICRHAMEDPMKVLAFREQRDPASLLATKLMKEATNVNILCGMASNEAHEDIGISFEKKLGLIRELERILTMTGKQVKINYC